MKLSKDHLMKLLWLMAILIILVRFLQEWISLMNPMMDLYQVVYNPEEDGSLNGFKVENLFTDTDEADRTIMLDYDAIFLNSGVRGLGSYVYNGVENDDMFLLDELALENVRSFVQAGRTLVVSDWAGDLIEQVWPDKITFVNEENCSNEDCFDIAQVGSNEKIIATIENDNLMNQLEVDSIQLRFDYSYWTAMKEVSDDVDVFSSRGYYI